MMYWLVRKRNEQINVSSLPLFSLKYLNIPMLPECAIFTWVEQMKTWPIWWEVFESEPSFQSVVKCQKTDSLKASGRCERSYVHMNMHAGWETKPQAGTGGAGLSGLLRRARERWEAREEQMQASWSLVLPLSWPERTCHVRNAPFQPCPRLFLKLIISAVCTNLLTSTPAWLCSFSSCHL